MDQNYKAIVSTTFKKMTTKAILSVLFFLLVYILLILCGIGITALAVLGGIWIIAAKPMFITIMIGAGLLCMGLLVLVFLFGLMFFFIVVYLLEFVILNELDVIFVLLFF